MPVEKKGSKGSSPKVHQYFKVEGDKVTKIRKNCSRCGKGVFMSEQWKMWINRRIEYSSFNNKKLKVNVKILDV